MAIYSGTNTFWQAKRGIVQNELVLNLDAGVSEFYNGGTAWRDLSGRGNNGALTNGPIFNGANGGSIVFDGSNDFLEFGDVLDLGTNSMTVNIWFKLSLADANSGTLLSKSKADVQNYRYAVGMSTSRTLSAFIQGNSGSSAFDIEPRGNTVLNLNQWYMGTWVFDRSSSIQIYLNGVLETLTGNAAISQWNNLNFQSNNPFRVGTYTTSNNVGLISVYNGLISSVQLYHRVFSQQEILRNFNATRKRFGL